MEGTDDSADWPKAWCEEHAEGYKNDMNATDHDLEEIRACRNVVQAEIAELELLGERHSETFITKEIELKKLDNEEQRLKTELEKWSGL